MFSDDKNIDNIETLFKEIQHYILLQRDFLKLQMVEKLTIIASALIVLLFVGVLSLAGLFYLSIALVHTLAPMVGGLTWGYTIVGIAFLLMALGLYLFRKPLIIRPIIRFLGRVLLQDN